MFTALVKPIRYDLCKRLQSVLDGGLQRLVGSGGFFLSRDCLLYNNLVGNDIPINAVAMLDMLKD